MLPTGHIYPTTWPPTGCNRTTASKPVRRTQENTAAAGTWNRNTESAITCQMCGIHLRGKPVMEQLLWQSSLLDTTVTDWVKNTCWNSNHFLSLTPEWWNWKHIVYPISLIPAWKNSKCSFRRIKVTGRVDRKFYIIIIIICKITENSRSLPLSSSYLEKTRLLSL